MVQTSGSVALNTKNIFCLCNYSYRDYILYMKYLFSQSVSVFYLLVPWGRDAKHLLSIFLSRQLSSAAGKVQAVVPAVTLLLLKVCLKPGTLWLKLKHLYLSVSAVLSTWNMLIVMWTVCHVWCKQSQRREYQLPGSIQCGAEGWDTVDRPWWAKWIRTKATGAKFWKRGLTSLLLSEGKRFFCKM